MSNQRSYSKSWLYQLKKTIRTSQVEKYILFLFILFISLTTYSQQQCDQIKINQVGYYPNSSKLALITYNTNSEDFYIVTSDGNDTVYQGTLGDRKKSAYSSTVTRIADFSLLTTTGSYILRIDDKQSFPFEIKNDVYTDLGKAVLKSFYFQRSSIALEQAYAGKWNRDAKKTGDVVVIQPSTFSDARGTFIASPGGWYDRGDYDKYMVSSGITTSTLLSAYEDFTNYFDTLRTNIPESGNKVPDVLNEIIYNLRWMLTMQDPFDGGVYGKCVNAKFDEIALHGVSSNAETVHKTTAATLDFAAVMAQAGRIFRRIRPLSALSDSCLRASANAWIWAVKNPDVESDQALPNKDFKSAAYRAKALQLDDEWLWAGSEMFVTSRNRMYFDVLEQNIDDSASLPTINNVGMLAYYSMLRYADNMPSYSWDVIKLMRDRVLRMANKYLAHISSSAFYTVMGQSKNDFAKGSNSVAANQAILLINAYLSTGEEKYVSASMTNLDYLLGRNATGYCFVTGCFGIKSPVHPYYRISNDIGEPVPGLLVAGPCSGRDKAIFFSSSQEIETSYQDSDSGTDANQVSIDWNSSMVYLVNAVEAMQYELGFSRKPSSTIAVNR